MDQGIIDTFKVYCLRSTFYHPIKATTYEHAPTLTDFFKKYIIGDAIENINISLNEVTGINIRAIRKNIITHYANDFVDMKTHFIEVTNQITEIGHKIGFKEWDSINIIECIQSNANEVNDETFINIDKKRAL